ncbi:MAG: hypothetical protein WBF77_07025 [Sulfurimonadaceae bacterium]
MKHHHQRAFTRHLSTSKRDRKSREVHQRFEVAQEELDELMAEYKEKLTALEG